MLESLIVDYVNDTENAKKNYHLGLEYERIGQTAAAISYFLRASERTKDNLLAYECLIRIGKCFDRQGNRNYTVKSMYQAAIALMPKRPEAYYFLSKMHEFERNHFDAYTMVEIALSVSDYNITPIHPDYFGKAGLLIQKALNGWWRGRGDEARKTLQVVLNEHWNDLDAQYKALVENNIRTLGSGSAAFHPYNSSQHGQLRYKFPGSEKINNNYSQVYQDMFVLSMLNGKRDGTFVEIGGASPFEGNNTYLLEKDFNWNGISVELNDKYAGEYRAARPNVDIHHVDALAINYYRMLKERFGNNRVIDYLQLDIDPAQNTYECLLKIPFDTYKFRVITYEHDHYSDVTRSYRDKSREHLKSKGYVLVVNDVSPDDIGSFEDWWVHPELVDAKILKRMMSVTNQTQDIKKYMLKAETQDSGKLSGFPTVHCVSLEESGDRRANLDKWLKKYDVADCNYHLFKRYKEYDYTIVGTLVDKLADHSKGPITSHLRLLKDLYEKYDDEYFFVAEDDLSLEAVQYWNFTWKEFIDSLPSDWKCVQLSVIREYHCDQFHFTRRNSHDWSAASYLIKREHIKFLLDNYYNSEIFTLNIVPSVIPVVEQVLFPNNNPGIYTFPLFVEDCYNTISTLTLTEKLLNNQGHYHHEAYDNVINWWKNIGKDIKLEEIMRGEMKHIYHEPQFGEDWFTYSNLYREMVNKFPHGSKFVEIGSWKGKSSAFMAVQIANSYKKIDFYCVDTWQGSVEHQEMDDVNSLYDTFMNNMQTLRDYHTSIRLASLDAAKTFADKSLDFVFIDASHEYQDVKNDIAAWLPKVKVGGILAGHDYYIDGGYFPGVKQAVDESFDVNELIFKESCWIYNVKEKKADVVNFYAEFDTDKYLREKFFANYDYRGTIVEVGAGPPTFISTSKHFRENGWRSICVEPNPKFVEQHKNCGSEVYQYACSDTEGKSSFVINLNNDNSYSEQDDGVSFSALQIKFDSVPEHNKQHVIEVEKIKLNTLLERISVEKIDILSIDVEGWEISVLKGFDHMKYSPKVIVLENFDNNTEYEPYMLSIGYKKIDSLGYNEVYVPYTVDKSEKEDFFMINKNKQNTSWIVDSFYANPDKVRKFALEQEYLEGGIGKGFIGRRTHQQFLFPSLKGAFEQIMSMKITNWENHGMNGRFQVAWAGEQLVYHCDSQRWAGMLYLTPGAPFQCGTTLYANKKTRARTYYDQGWDAAWKDVPGDCHLDGTPFEPVDVLGNVYNRLVIFDASCIHSASQYFGTVTTNARLWQMFFFDAE